MDACRYPRQRFASGGPPRCAGGFKEGRCRCAQEEAASGLLRPLWRGLRLRWRQLQASRQAGRVRRQQAAQRRRDGRRLSGLGACEAHVQSRYGLLKGREDSLG